MKVTLSVDHKTAIEISHKSLDVLIGFLDDDSAHAELFDTLVSHPSSRVRIELAAKEHLSVESYERLAHDASVEVVQRLAGNMVALKSLALATLKVMFERDISIASELIHWGLDELDPQRKKTVLSALGKYDDPAILDALENL